MDAGHIGSRRESRRISLTASDEPFGRRHSIPDIAVLPEFPVLARPHIAAGVIAGIAENAGADSSKLNGPFE